MRKLVYSVGQAVAFSVHGGSGNGRGAGAGAGASTAELVTRQLKRNVGTSSGSIAAAHPSTRESAAALIVCWALRVLTCDYVWLV